MNEELKKRPATNADLDLIFEILRTTMGKYVEQTWGVWDEAVQRERFKEVKVEDHFILQLSGEDVGCLSYRESETEVRLARIFILPQYQNRGFGTQIIREIMAEANCKGLPIRLTVLRVNPARLLYERLGFNVVGENKTHYTMLRPPDPASS
jgi:ribosomal protein S18 acetylase RimI-like enzyme